MKAEIVELVAWYTWTVSFKSLDITQLQEEVKLIIIEQVF